MGEDNGGYLPFPKGFATKAIHAGHEPEQWDSMCVVPPIVLSSTFKQYGPTDFKKYQYTRYGNPTRDVLQLCLAELEGAKYGLVFSSGLGASTALLSLLDAGDHIICNDVHGGTNRILDKVVRRHGIESSFVDACFPELVEASVKKNTKLIWVESLTNPTLKVIDIEAISKISKAHSVLLVVDNTFLTSYLQRPLDFGADIVIYSLAKYVDGHSDVLTGSIMTNDETIYERLKFTQIALGIVPSPFDCYQVSRGLKTLALRMNQHSHNALKVAQFLEAHPNVSKVLHPGLTSHPQHELFKKQTSGHSGIISFYIKDGTLKETRKFLDSLKIFVLTNSLGSFQSLAEAPSMMTHVSVPPEQLKRLQITDNMVRLSVGLEDEEDLIDDLNNALDLVFV